MPWDKNRWLPGNPEQGSHMAWGKGTVNGGGGTRHKIPTGKARFTHPPTHLRDHHHQVKGKVREKVTTPGTWSYKENREMAPLLYLIS